MAICYIGIGSNLGDRRRNIGAAISEIEKSSTISLRRVSSIYETEPVGEVPQGKFLNGVLEIETNLTPRQLLKELNGIEDDLGRERRIRNGPRTMDLDILYYADEVVNEDDLVIPHPRIGQREFVLRGLGELHKSMARKVL